MFNRCGVEEEGNRIMAEIQKTNVCCIDLRQDCIDYLKGLGLAVYEGSFGSVF